MELSFGEQILIILKRQNMTIQDLAELYEASTGTKMTRQNLSQRLRRDNFPEQDMRQLAALLGYQLSLQLIPDISAASFSHVEQMQSLHQIPPKNPTPAPALEEPKQVITADGSTLHIPTGFRKPEIKGDINPLTGKEYLTNTVRRHPSLDDYVQVYDRSTHEWIDVNEDYFWKFQANKKQILGRDYQEPILI
jgi:transcriptional regulator with XRE-family HTH domain